MTIFFSPSLNAYYVPGTILGAGENKIPAFMNFTV